MKVEFSHNCPQCSAPLKLAAWNENYGADADGNRGVPVYVFEVLEGCSCELTDEAQDAFDYQLEEVAGLALEQADAAQHETLYRQWQQAGGKCGCGQPLSFDDAWAHGACLDCLQKPALELSREPGKVLSTLPDGQNC